FAQLVQAIADVCELYFIEAAGHLFAVAGNERNGASVIEERNDRTYLSCGQRKFLANTDVMIHIPVGILFLGILFFTDRLLWRFRCGWHVVVVCAYVVVDAGMVVIMIIRSLSAIIVRLTVGVGIMLICAGWRRRVIFIQLLGFMVFHNCIFHVQILLEIIDLVADVALDGLRRILKFAYATAQPPCQFRKLLATE